MHDITLHLYAIHAIHKTHQVQVLRTQCVKKDYSCIVCPITAGSNKRSYNDLTRHCHNTTSLFYNPVSPL